MNNEPYIFISYSRQDLTFVERLSNDLNTSGIRVWLDVNQILPGESWDDQIQQALEEASVVIVVLSKNSTESQAVKDEINYFMEDGKTILPIVIDDCDIPFRLRRFQYLDFRPDYHNAFQGLLKILPSTLYHEQPVEPREKKSKGYIFISYAEEDSEFVGLLRSFLKDRGYGYWDYQESDRNYHIQFFLELETVIRDAIATLSILSSDWKKSEWALKEYLFSVEVDTPVFLLKARELGPTLVIAGVPFIDFVKDKDEGFHKLDRELKRKGL